jgi:hypothetical protein
MSLLGRVEVDDDKVGVAAHHAHSGSKLFKALGQLRRMCVILV